MAEDRMEEQAVVQQESDPEKLIVTSFYPGASTALLFKYWTQPELLRQWWPPEAELDARLGGKYHLSWPAMDWNLRGTYTVFEPEKTLAFTWRWDHEPDTPTRDVTVTFEPIGDVGTQLTVTHGVYTASARDQEERSGHLDGWIYFLTRLHEALA